MTNLSLQSASEPLSTLKREGKSDLAYVYIPPGPAGEAFAAGHVLRRISFRYEWNQGLISGRTL